MEIKSISKCIYCGSVKDLTLDRIDDKKEYIEGNAIIACRKCNTLRSDKYTVEEMKMIFPLLYGINLIELEIEKIIDQNRDRKI